MQLRHFNLRVFGNYLSYFHLHSILNLYRDVDGWTLEVNAESISTIASICSQGAEIFFYLYAQLDDRSQLLQNQRITFSSAHPFTPLYVEKHLSKSANLDPKALYENRVKGRSVLLENPVRESRVKKERDEKKARRAKEKAQKQLGLIGRKEAKLRGLWELEEEQKKFVMHIKLVDFD